MAQKTSNKWNNGESKFTHNLTYSKKEGKSKIIKNKHICKEINSRWRMGWENLKRTWVLGASYQANQTATNKRLSNKTRNRGKSTEAHPRHLPWEGKTETKSGVNRWTFTA